jgi:hypothetical protein
MNLEFVFWKPKMKILPKRLVAMVLLVSFMAIVCIQGVALADSGEGGDGGGKILRTLASNRDHERSSGGGDVWSKISRIWDSPSNAAREAGNGAVGNAGELNRSRQGSGDISDRQRRDVVKEVTGRSHIGGGGPQ